MKTGKGGSKMSRELDECPGSREKSRSIKTTCAEKGVDRMERGVPATRARGVKGRRPSIRMRSSISLGRTRGTRLRRDLGGSEVS